MKNETNNWAVLACDPSFTAFGWSVIIDKKVVDCGCIKTASADKKLRIRKGDDRIQRMSTITTVLFDVIKKYSIQFIVSEQPHGSQSAIAANLLGMVTGLIHSMAFFSNIGIEWYNEADCKKAILFKNTAVKSEMIDAVKKIYDVKWKNVKYHDEAVADSIAVFHVAYKNSSVLKTLMP